VRLLPDLALTPGGWVADRAIAITDGRIAFIGPVGAVEPGDVRLRGKALLPGTVNAHCHTFQSLLRGLGDDLDFMGWRDRVLYPFSERLDRNGIALGAAFAFAEMLCHGATTCVDFFYLNDDGNENAEAVIEAARRVGIRLVLARALYDWEGAPKRYRESVPDARRRVESLIARHRHDETVDVHPAPHSPHGASSAMIRAGWEVAEQAGTPFHIHVAEGQYEGQRTLAEHGATPIRYLDALGVLGPRTIAVHCVWLDDDEIALMAARGAALAYCPSSNMFTPFHIHVAEGQYEGQRTLAEHGATPIRYLDTLGVLGPRTIAVHCVWLDDDEIALMAARGAALAYCPSSNMFLGDGISRVTEMLAAGVRAGLGTDGGCTNNRLSVFEEARMTSLLQRVRHLDGTALGAKAAFDLGTRSGAAMLGLDTGTIARGQLADLVAVDLGDPSLHPRTDLLASVVYAMSPRAITDVWVHGRPVVADRRLTTLDMDELLARVRALTTGWRL